MNRIEHIVEPRRLFLVWRPNSEGQVGWRRIVGELTQKAPDEPVRLRYNVESDEFVQAIEKGFTGYPAFGLSSVEHSRGVVETFLRRIPPRNREDFSEYLARHRLPEKFEGSDLALLGYTGAKLPGDGFELCLDFHDARPPFEFVMEVAGFRYQKGVAVNELSVGDVLSLRAEPNNEHDNQAVAVYFGETRIGYVPRTYASAFNEWMNNGYNIDAIIERINGTAERPLIYVFVSVR